MVAGVEPAGSGPARLTPAHLQQETSANFVADTSEELRRRAAHIDRIAGDQDLIGQLRRDGFVGVDWNEAAGELVRYAIAVIRAWVLNGKIYEKCAEKKRPVPRPPFYGAFDEDEAESLAGEVVTVALSNFRNDVLLPGSWDPSKGASLTTYFVGQCVLCFPNIYRSQLAAVPPGWWDQPDFELIEGAELAVEDAVVQQRMAGDALDQVHSEQAKKAFVLTAMGYTQPQIAERLNTTTKAVERALDYARKQIDKGKESA